MTRSERIELAKNIIAMYDIAGRAVVLTRMQERRLLRLAYDVISLLDADAQKHNYSLEELVEHINENFKPVESPVLPPLPKELFADMLKRKAGTPGYRDPVDALLLRLQSVSNLSFSVDRWARMRAIVSMWVAQLDSDAL